MVDSLGPRMKFGVIAPSTNTSVQPEYDDMRPVGVTNHFGRIHISDNPVHSDADFEKLLEDIRVETLNAVDQVKTCSPGALIMACMQKHFGTDWKARLNWSGKCQHGQAYPFLWGQTPVVRP